LRGIFLIGLIGSSSHALAASTAGACKPPAAAVGGPVNNHTRYVERNLFPAVMEMGAKPLSLSDRMQAYGVPGVSVAVIHKGELAWARGWGVRDSRSCKPVTPETVFQSASISKAVTAALALRLVEQGKLSLDQDINRFLRSWRLPSKGSAVGTPVTLRHLLSHTAGLNVQGFPGYRVGTAVPNAIQVLDGQPPANTEAVRITTPPGAEWRYSGGGYVITQVAIEDVTGGRFQDVADKEIFSRLGMKHSAYSQPLSGMLAANAASGHSEGKVIPGAFHIYPELGPAGLWTTPSDLARFLLDLQASANGNARGRLLSPGMTKEMLAPIKGDWGLGPALYGSGAGRRFGHDGVNEGFQSTMVAYVGKGDGVIVLTNGAGKRLADEIVRAVATDYGWAELASKPTIEVALPSAALAAMAGRYEGGGLSVYLDLREGHLFAQTGGPEPERLIALSPTRFKTSVSGIVIEFDKASNGSPTGFRITEGGPPIRLLKVAAAASDPFELPLFVRGSMNQWGTTTPLLKSVDGSLTAELSLGAGEHQLKIGAENWDAADFGAVSAEPIAEQSKGTVLVPHGGNIRLRISEPGTFRFELKRTSSGPVLTITRMAGS
jgi:CubicO group peptidase (beta-lactamase class C family)